MGPFSFKATAGKKIFAGNAEADAGLPVKQLNAEQLDAIRKHVESFGLNIYSLGIQQTAPGQLTVTGESPSQAASEKAVLLAGNIMGITKVEDQMTVAASPGGREDPVSDTYEVKSGDTLWSIAAQCYGNAASFQKILDANKPMLENAEDIYPGEVLRIPKAAY